MKLKKIEVHRVIVTKHFDIDDEEIIKVFGSIDKFFDEMEDTDQWYEFTNEADYEREENWISDSKGYTEESWEIDEDG